MLLATSIRAQHLNFVAWVHVAYAPNMYLINLWPYILHFTFWATFMTWHCINDIHVCVGMAWHMCGIYKTCSHFLKCELPHKNMCPLLGIVGKWVHTWDIPKLETFDVHIENVGIMGKHLDYCWFIFQPSCQLSCTHKGMYTFQSRMHISCFHMGTCIPMIREHMFPIVITHFTFGHIKESHNNLHFFCLKSMWNKCLRVLAILLDKDLVKYITFNPCATFNWSLSLMKAWVIPLKETPNKGETKE